MNRRHHRDHTGNVAVDNVVHWTRDHCYLSENAALAACVVQIDDKLHRLLGCLYIHKLCSRYLRASIPRDGAYRRPGIQLLCQMVL